MAHRPPRLTVRYTPTALRHLDAIWDHNAGTYGPDHADRYIAFLRTNADGLGTAYGEGKPVPTYPDYLYATLKRGRRGHGHVVVYAMLESAVEVLAFYHTAQDWQGRVVLGER